MIPGGLSLGHLNKGEEDKWTAIKSFTGLN